MDELQLLTRARPDPDPPTPVERAAIRSAVMDHVAEGPVAARIEGPGWDDVPTGRPGSRPGTRLALAAAAVVLVVAAVVAALSLGDDERGIEQTPVDEPAPSGTYPPPPYTVEVLISAEGTGGTAPARSVEGRVLVHQVDDEVGVADMTGCMECDGTMLMLHQGEVPPEGPPAEVRAAVDELLAEATDPGHRLTLILDALDQPEAGPMARAELLRALDLTDGLAVEEGATTATGAVGTRYSTTAAEWGARSVVLDPEDAYILETHSVTEADPGAVGIDYVVGPAGRFAPDARIETRISYARPAAADRLPADVLELAETVRTPPQGRPGTCTAASGNEDLDGATLETPVPTHLAFVYCPSP